MTPTWESVLRSPRLQRGAAFPGDPHTLHVKIIERHQTDARRRNTGGAAITLMDAVRYMTGTLGEALADALEMATMPPGAAAAPRPLHRAPQGRDGPGRPAIRPLREEALLVLRNQKG